MVKHMGLFSLKEGVDVEAFEKNYREGHVRLASTLPGLRRYTRSLVRSSAKHQAPFYRIAELYFDDMDALRRALASPQWEALGKDTGFLSQVKDMVLLICEEEEMPLP